MPFGSNIADMASGESQTPETFEASSAAAIATHSGRPAGTARRAAENPGGGGVAVGAAGGATKGAAGGASTRAAGRSCWIGQSAGGAHALAAARKRVVYSVL